MRTFKPGIGLARSDAAGRCQIEDRRSGRRFEFGPAECALLELIGAGLAEQEILARFNQQGTDALSVEELREFFALLDDWGLLEGEASAQAADPAGAQATTPLPAPETDTDTDTVSADDAVMNQPNRWHLFDPQPLLTILCRSLCGGGRWFAWLAWALFVFGVFGAVFNAHLLQQDLGRAIAHFGIIGRFVFVAFSVNLLSQVARGLVARHFGLRTPSFGLMLLFGLIPRFNLQAIPAPGLNARARSWIFGASILSRLALFGIGILGWLTLRAQGLFLSSLFIELAFLSALGLVFVANPLWRGDGYHLFTIWLNQPGLRERGNLAVSGLFKPSPAAIRRHSRNRLWFAIYALLSYLFLLGFVGFIGAGVAQRLEEQYRGAGVALFVLLVVYVGWNLLRQRRAASAARRSKGQARQPIGGDARLSSAPVLREQPAASVPAASRSTWVKWLKWILIIAVLVIVALLPYRYDPGGKVTIAPVVAHPLHAEAAGIVEEVLARGGERLTKGTLVARLANHRQQKDVLSTEALVAAKQHEIDVLRATPSPEELAFAEAQLATAKLRLTYSRDEAERMQRLFEKGTVSLQLNEDARGQMELDMQQVVEREASLRALKTQVRPSQIAALEMELAGLEEQLRFHREQLRRTELRMPSDGHITTLNLGNLRNAYLEEGNLFAEVEDSSKVRIEIRVPEAEISHVRLGEPVVLRVPPFPRRVFRGEVTEIGLTASEESFGQVITVVSEIDNPDGELISGMTGFAKIAGTEMPVILAFTQALQRFFHIELWSWLP